MSDIKVTAKQTARIDLDEKSTLQEKSDVTRDCKILSSISHWDNYKLQNTPGKDYAF